MKPPQFFAALIFFLVVLGAPLAAGQAAPTAYGRQLSLTAGGLGSLFQPDYQGIPQSGVPSASPQPLIGVGAYVDARFSRWFGIEAEGRWLRFNQREDIYQDNYLLGYRHSFDGLRFRGFTPYAKILVGYGRMNFEYNAAHGRFTDIAYGGGLDMHTGGRLTIRPVDFEYQQWPSWLGTTLHPWGVSAGIGYTILGR